MNRADPLRVLLVEDDEDDFVLTQSMLLANGRTKFDLEWEQSYTAALRRGARRPATTCTSSTTGWASTPGWTSCATRGEPTRRRR